MHPVSPSLLATHPLTKPLRGWQGKRGATSVSTSRRFPVSALSSSSPLESSTNSGATTSPFVSPKVLSGPEGAEWAGWECKFSVVDGKRVAVPEDYVPESLREWDVEVTSCMISLFAYYVAL